MVEKQREDEMRKSIEAQIEYKQWQNEKKRQEEELERRRRQEQDADFNSNGSSQVYSPLRSRP